MMYSPIRQERPILGEGIFLVGQFTNAANSISIFCYRLYHETFQTHLVLEPTALEANGEAVFRFRGFCGDYAVSVIDTHSGMITALPELYSLK
jgi:hypothetical protein